MLSLQDILHRALAFIVYYLPIPLRVKLWQYALHRGSCRWPRESTAQRIPGGMYAKIGERVVRLSEGQALRHIHAHTTGVPAPRVIDNFTHKGVTYLIMTRLPGYPLHITERYLRIDSEVEQFLSAQLTRLLAPVRALPAPSEAVCAFDGGPVYDVRIRYPDGLPAGPWSSVSAFHEDLVRRTYGLNFPESIDAEAALDVIKRAHAREHRVCLTHNDLGPHNILVDDNWVITGIVDWEAAAWMPEYWEYTKGTFLPPYRKRRWLRILTVTGNVSRNSLDYESCRAVGVANNHIVQMLMHMSWFLSNPFG